ncbi:MAG: metallophosphoesterase [Candidatus Rokuibacteriota bacterium]|nr:MAG: metallophosphoesterase [Candidatus Rokubacteria bacterium]
MALNGGSVVRVAAVGDLHCGRESQGALQPLFARATEAADVLALCGDLTDYGLPDEARVLARELAGTVRIPILAVFGNHDFESGHADEVHSILTEAGVRILDGDSVEINGVGFAGVKGFAGGFGDRALQSWGEPVLKRFVREAVEEALKLEGALARIHAPRRVAILHYSPIRSTVDPEPPEVVPFLGSSRLEEPINRYAAVAALHGHAHHGTPEGQTSTGVPVYNVSVPVLKAAFPDRPPFRLLEIAVPREEAAPAAAVAS